MNKALTHLSETENGRLSVPRSLHLRPHGGGGRLRGFPVAAAKPCDPLSLFFLTLRLPCLVAPLSPSHTNIDDAVVSIGIANKQTFFFCRFAAGYGYRQRFLNIISISPFFTLPYGMCSRHHLPLPSLRQRASPLYRHCGIVVPHCIPVSPGISECRSTTSSLRNLRPHHRGGSAVHHRHAVTSSTIFFHQNKDLLPLYRLFPFTYLHDHGLFRKSPSHSE